MCKNREQPVHGICTDLGRSARKQQGYELGRGARHQVLVDGASEAQSVGGTSVPQYNR